MTTEITKKGIKYNWHLAGPQGIEAELLPVKGIHSHEELTEAKEEVREACNIAVVEVRWIEPELNEKIKVHRHLHNQDIRKEELHEH